MCVDNIGFCIYDAKLLSSFNNSPSFQSMFFMAVKKSLILEHFCRVIKLILVLVVFIDVLLSMIVVGFLDMGLLKF